MSFRSHALRLFALPTALAYLLVAPARSETIWYVNPSASGAQTGLDWANAFRSPDLALAAASATLDAAGNSDQIWVTEGLYRPPVVFAAGVFVSNWFVVNKPVRLYGGFKGTETSVLHRSGSFKRTILDGNIGNVNFATDNSLHVVSVANVAGVNGNPGVLIDGFQIRNGWATGNGIHGGGILSTLSDLDLVNCFLRTNYAVPQTPGVNQGGGLYFTSMNGGLYPDVGFRLRIKDCEFEDNHGQSGGGAIFGDCLRGEIVNTKVFDNLSMTDGAGVYLMRMGTENDMDFTNCVFWDNFCASGQTSTRGGGIYLGSGGGESSSSRANIVNCTFAGNFCDGSPQIDGQALGIATSSQATVYNSVFFWNGSNGIGNLKPIDGPATVNYSDVEGTWLGAGSNNIAVDPLFVGLFTGNLALSSGSLCLDAADYSRLPADTLDLDGDGNLTEVVPVDYTHQARLIDQGSVADTGTGSAGCSSCTYLDMGAYERP